MNAPDDCHIHHALKVAARSPCHSKRGVVLFNATTGAHRGEGFNGPPAPLTCPGRDRCAGNCGQRSVHAEMRALRDAEGYRRHHESGPFELLHVELAPPEFVRIEVDRSADGLPIGGAPHRLIGQVSACDGPNCIACAREILDCGFVGDVWLYERSNWLGIRVPGCDHWRRYSAEEFYRVTLKNCGVRP